MTTDNPAPDSPATPQSKGPAHEPPKASPKGPPAPTYTAPFPPTPDAPASARRKSPAVLPWLLLIVVIAAAGVGGWSFNQKLDRVQQEIAKRQQASDTAAATASAELKQSADTLRDVQTRLTSLEARVADSNSQQAALQQLYQDLARNRDDWVLAETDQIVNSANQQLQLTGNVRGALIALEGADARLAKTSAPQMAGLRAALQKDIEKLKAVPTQDLAQLAGNLDQAIAQIDSLPLQAEEIAPTPDNASADAAANGSANSSASPPATGSGWRTDWHIWWQRLRHDMAQSLMQLVQVRRLDGDAMLVSPDQGYFLRANLKLRLLNARLALLGRNQAVLHGDLATAQAALDKYFDGKSRKTIAVKALLKQVGNDSQAVALPTLDDSLAAIARIKNTR